MRIISNYSLYLTITGKPCQMHANERPFFWFSTIYISFPTHPFDMLLQKGDNWDTRIKTNAIHRSHSNWKRNITKPIDDAIIIIIIIIIGFCWGDLKPMAYITYRTTALLYLCVLVGVCVWMCVSFWPWSWAKTDFIYITIIEVVTILWKATSTFSIYSICSILVAAMFTFVLLFQFLSLFISKRMENTITQCQKKAVIKDIWDRLFLQKW